MVAKRVRESSMAGGAGMIWGYLKPLNPATSVVYLSGDPFTVGEGYDFNLCVGNHHELNILWCNIEWESNNEGNGPVVMIERKCDRFIEVNGISNFIRTPLCDGDVIVFGSSDKFAYQFELKEKLTMPVSRLEARSRFHEARSGSCAQNFKVIDFKDISVTFDQFPHHLSHITRSLLIRAAYMHLKKTECAGFTVGLPVLCPRILLSGPPGSDVYRETVIKALTHYFGGKLILISSCLAIDELLEVVSLESATNPLIMFIKEVQDMQHTSYIAFENLLRCLPKNVVVVASETETKFEDEKLNELFPNKVRIEGDEALLKEWKEHSTSQLNRASISSALSHYGLYCRDIEALSIKNKQLSGENVEKVIGWGICDQFMTGAKAKFKNGKLIISSASLLQGLELLKEIQDEKQHIRKSLKDVTTDNEYEKNLLGLVIPPCDIGVTFDDIGALINVKETLQELVMLPLQRPELFNKGQLIKPCKGVLLFGPPGTGKTMLAKALATEASAHFLNISQSDINSQWFGEGEKYVKAIFTLARKISPAVIFLDEVDGMLGRRKRSGEHEAMRKMKNEFMVNWDGLCTKENERVLVLAATNRPFDLDEAVIRRFPRRLMVSLPDAQNREKIIKVTLAAEELGPDVDLKAVAKMTEGYSGSDLKNLCVAAALHPIRQILEKEKRDKASALANKRPLPSLHTSSDIRALSMADFKCAREQISASVADTIELEVWNEQYGEGGSTKKSSPPLTYFM